MVERPDGQGVRYGGRCVEVRWNRSNDHAGETMAIFTS